MTDPGRRGADAAQGGGTDTISVRFLGAATVLVNGQPAGGQASHRHRIALLAVLVVSGRPVSRDKLIALLWPERDTESARNLLKVALYALRKFLGEDAIRSVGDQLVADETALVCDVMEFESAIRSGADEHAARAYGGVLLDGFHLKDAPELERFIENERVRLARSYDAVLERLALGAAARRDTAGAAQWWRKLAARDPLRTDVALHLMRALADSGDVTGALRHEEIHTQLRHDMMDLEPDPAVLHLAAELRSAPAAPVSRTSVRVEAAVAPVAVHAEARSGAVDVTPPAPQSRGKYRPLLIGMLLLAVLGIVTVYLWRADSRPRTESAANAPVASTNPDATPDGGSLAFNGAAVAVTPLGQVVTNRVDDIAVDLMVRYGGGRRDHGIQVIYYNGNTGLSGWGLMVLQSDSIWADGTIAVLAGGQAIAPTPLVLRRGTWQHLVAERHNGQITLTLDDLSFSVGPMIVNRIGGHRSSDESTTIGAALQLDGKPTQGFVGSIARVGIRDLTTGDWIERWNMSEENGRTITGQRGTVLRLTGVTPGGATR